MDQQILKNILEKHRKWVMGEPDGERADLRSADLRSADLRSADLSSADLRSADLRSADLRYANLRSADLSSADLRYANLRSADLRYANLRSAYLRSADLSYADLSSADLRSADLRYADLRSAYLSSADLRYADLSSADLRSADLSSADLSSADLSYADLRSADLSYANLKEIKEDFFKVLAVAKAEVIGLYDALIRGKVDGSNYSGECACLVGTVAKIRNENYEKLSIDLKPDADRPAEKWFMGIQKGDTPQNNPVSKITAAWAEEFMGEHELVVPKYKMVSSIEVPNLF